MVSTTKRWTSFLWGASAVVATVAAAGTIADNEGFCNAPDLPNDLSLELAVEGGGVRTDREVHLHGLYRIGLDDYSEVRGSKVHEMKIRFDDSKDKNAGDYAFRMAVAPHDADSIDLYLFNGLCKKVTADSRPIVSASSVTTEDDAEQHIYSVLKANTDYCLQMAYTTTTQSGTPSDSSGDCATVLLEMAFQPEKKLKRFVDACEYDDGSVPKFPNPIKPHDENDNNYYFEHDSTVDDKKTFWAKYDANKLGQHTKVVAKYPIDLPRIHGRNQRWKFWMSLQSRFLDAGDLTVILTAGDDQRNVPNPTLCSPRVLHSNHKNEQNDPTANGQMVCWFGTRAIKNHVILQSELWSPNKYVMWVLMNKRGEGSSTCAPYSIDMKIFPLPEKESFVTCDIDPMPHTFNVPGMYNEALGTMTFSQDILVNLTADRECATIRTTKPNSLLRAFVGAHANLDLDITLEEAGCSSSSVSNSASIGHSANQPHCADKQWAPVATSSRVSGPDAVLYVLKRDVEYQVCVLISHTVRDYLPGQDHDFYDFCDSYDLRVDVFPLTAATGSICTSSSRKNEPRFDGLQQILDRDGEFRFGIADYSQFPFSAPLDLTTAPGQQDLFKFDFTVKETSSFRTIAMPVDPVGTPVVLTLYRKRKAFDDSDVTLFMPIAYGEPLTVGQKLGWTLEQGTYRLEMSTAPMQLTEARSWSSWLQEMTSGAGRGTPLSTAVLPSCINYNFEVIVTNKQQCLDAMPLPNRISPTAVAHRHIEEKFTIPAEKTHEMVISVDADMKRASPKLVAHFLVSRTDVPVTISIFDDSNYKSDAKPLMVSQSTPSGAAELFAVLDSLNEYRVRFTYNHASATSDSLCRSMQMQLSVVGQQEEQLAEQCQASLAMSYNSDIVPMSTTEDLSMGLLAVPFDFSGRVLKMEATVAERKGTSFTRRLHFSTPKETSFRLTAEYEFPTHIVSARVCKCTPQRRASNYARSSSAETVCVVSEGSDGSSECFSASGYFNGVQVPAIQIPKGDYVIELRWSAMSGKVSTSTSEAEMDAEDGAGYEDVGDSWVDNGDVAESGKLSSKDTSFCALVYVQFSIASVLDPVSALNVATPTQSALNAADGMMCDPELQYLPKSLNAVAYVWAGYNDEIHFYQNLLVPMQHESDSTTIKVTKTSLLRVSIPSDIVRAVVVVSNEEYAFSSVENGFAVSGRMAAFTKLEPGTYTISIGYYRNSAAANGGGMTNAGTRRMCSYLPFEMSIIPFASADLVTADPSRCDRASADLPTVPKFNRDAIRYRDLARVAMRGDAAFSYTIPFTIDARGGAVTFDLRYNFPMGGLNMMLMGAVADARGVLSAPRRLTWSRRTNRAFIDRELPAGQYNLTVFDPVDAAMYVAAGVSSSCVPFSLHMRATSYVVEDNTNTLPPNKGGNNNNNGGGGSSSSSKELTCPYTTYDKLPERVDFTDTDQQTLEVNGNGFPIPYASASASSGATNSAFGKKTVSVEVSLPARSGYTVRATATTRASVALEMQLIYDPTDTRQGLDEDEEEDIADDGSWAFTRQAGGTVVRPGQQVAVTAPSQYGFGGGVVNNNAAGSSASTSAGVQDSVASVVATSRLYGSTSSLTYTCAQGQCDNNGRFRLRITFSFDRPPRYMQDYDSCMRKFTLDSYRLLLGVHSAGLLLQGTKCSDTQLAMLDQSSREYARYGPRLPPPEVTIGSTALILSLPYAFLSDSDRVQRTVLREMVGPSYASGSSGSGNTNGVGRGGYGARPARGDAGPIGEGPSNYKLRTHVTFNTTLIVPDGVKNVTSYLQMRYNANFMNLKVELFRLVAIGGSSSSSGGRGGSRGGSNSNSNSKKVVRYEIAKDPIYEASGNPSITVDRSANAELHLLTSPLVSADQTYLTPGRYVLRFSANLPFMGPMGGGMLSGGSSNNGGGGGGRNNGAGGGNNRAGRFQQLEFCLPLSIYYMVTAAEYLPATTPPRGGGNNGGNHVTVPAGWNEVSALATTKAPHSGSSGNTVVDFSPRQLGSIDPSEPFSVTVTFSTPVMGKIRGAPFRSPAEEREAVERLAYLQESDQGRDKSKRPHTVAPISYKFIDERTLMLTFVGPKWMTTYRLRLDGTLLMPVDSSTDRGKDGYDASIINMNFASAYSSTYCSCDRQGLCVGGGGCGCTEVNGETCNTCQDGWTLSSTPSLLENGIRSRLCLKENMALPPAKTVAPGSSSSSETEDDVTTKSPPSNGGGGRGEGSNNGRPVVTPKPTSPPRTGGTNTKSPSTVGGSTNTGNTGSSGSSSDSSSSSTSSPVRTLLTVFGIGMLAALCGLYATRAMRQRAQRPIYRPLGSRPDAIQQEDDDDDDDDDAVDIIRPADMRPAAVGAATTTTASASPARTTAAVPIVMGSVVAPPVGTVVAPPTAATTTTTSSGNGVARTAIGADESTSSAIPMTRIPTTNTAAAAGAAQGASSTTSITIPTIGAGVAQNSGSGLTRARDPFADADDDDFFGPNNAAV